LDAEGPERLRLFIAVTLPEEVKAEVEKAQRELRRVVATGPVRWTSRDQFHLTLKFLGNVEAQRVAALTEALRRACRPFAPLQLKAEGVGFFPDSRFPRVAWVGVREAQDQLLPLQRAVEAAAQEFTAEEPDKRFSGHVTLGRIKNLKRPEAARLAEAAARMADRLFGLWTAAEVELIRSVLTPQGARYTTVASAPLGA
jgi:RNA 2',3'-cyclic 3'-phosphodiesterase